MGQLWEFVDASDNYRVCPVEGCRFGLDKSGKLYVFYMASEKYDVLRADTLRLIAPEHLPEKLLKMQTAAEAGRPRNG